MREKRYFQILSLLSSNRKREFITVTEFSKYYNVSTVTARKWLERARADGLLDVVYEEYRNVPTPRGILVTSKYFINPAGCEWLRAYNEARTRSNKKRA